MARIGHKGFKGHSQMHTAVKNRAKGIGPGHPLARLAKGGLYDHVELARAFVAGRISMIECAIGLYDLPLDSVSEDAAADLCVRWLAEQGHDSTRSTFTERVHSKVKKPSLFARVTQ